MKRTRMAQIHHDKRMKKLTAQVYALGFEIMNREVARLTEGLGL